MKRWTAVAEDHTIYSVKEDTEPKKVGDEFESGNTEKSETEEAVLNLIPVEAGLAENTETEERSW